MILLALPALIGNAFATTPKNASATAASRTAAKKAAISRSRHGTRRRAFVEPRRYVQPAPTPERYKEIQQALAARGYFKGDVNGTWGPDSIDALRRFQAGQNLEPDGKLGSLSLIALGLGPKRITAQAQPSEAKPQP